MGSLVISKRGHGELDFLDDLLELVGVTAKGPRNDWLLCGCHSKKPLHSAFMLRGSHISG